MQIQTLLRDSNTNVFKYKYIGKYFKYFFKYFFFRMYYYVGKRKATLILRHLVLMTGRPVLGGIVIANYITVTTDSKTSNHRGKSQHMLNMLSQEVHNKMPMLPSEETLLITARIL